MGYSPILGRFLQRDPIGYNGGLNLFEYVRSSPAGFVDPFGRKCYDVLMPYSGSLPTTGYWSQQSFMEETDENGNQCIVVKECCETITVIVEFSDLTGGETGHVGIGVDNDYFDMGPAKGQPWKLFGHVPAGPWWDSIFGTGKGTGDLPSVMMGINTGLLGSGGATYEIEVPQSDGEKVKSTWQQFYVNMAAGTMQYAVYDGVTCESTVACSLQGIGGVPRHSMQPWETPSDLARRLDLELKNTCGPNKGKPAKVTYY